MMPDEKTRYEAATARSRQRRLRWFQQARFGMFVHWGLYAQIGRNEWAMHIEGIGKEEYARLADTWRPGPRPMRQWCRLAAEAGMKYVVMTTKHHEGFCLWDTRQTDFNSVRRGPRRDLVREFVEACREFGLKVGLYYSLMDWHHPDGVVGVKDPAARRRFLDFTQGCVRELMSNYGRIDILWYDGAFPFDTPEGWESVRMNSIARDLQPHILINDRAILGEDFTTPEGQVRPADGGRAWEACMTFDDTSWGYMPSAAGRSHTAWDILKMLHTAAQGGGNLLLNIGPAPDGSVPPAAAGPLRAVGKWIAANREAVLGRFDRDPLWGSACAAMTSSGRFAYAWCRYWPGTSLTLGGYATKLKKASFLADGRAIRFEQAGWQIRLLGLPRSCPDKFAGVAVIQLEFASKPKFQFGPTTMNFNTLGIV